MDDLIYRQAAIDLLKDWSGGYDYIEIETEAAIKYFQQLQSARPEEPCDLCSNLEKGDTLYQSSDWDGGIGFDYIWGIQFCPKCGRSLE